MNDDVINVGDRKFHGITMWLILTFRAKAIQVQFLLSATNHRFHAIILYVIPTE